VESVPPTPTLRPPSVRLYVTDAIVVDPNASSAIPPAPISDLLCDALKVVDGFFTMYLQLGPVRRFLSVLQNALEAAVACCDDAINRSPADLPLLGNDCGR